MSSEESLASRPSFNQNLENARVLIEDAPWRDNPEKYRKVAEGILRRILKVDPANDPARRLLVKALAPLPQAKTPAAPPVEKAKPVLPHPRAKAPLPALAAPRRPARPSDLSFVVQTIASPVEEKKSSRSPWGLVGFMAVVAAIAGILMFVMRPNTLTTQYAPKSPITPPAIVHASGDMTGNNAASFRYSTAARTPTASPSTIPDPVPNLEAAAAEAPVTPEARETPETTKAPETPETPEPPKSIPVKSKVPPVAPTQTGTLAVSSPTTVDIYMGDKLVGSAPATLVLPAGNQTLEYRHQDMRRVMTHVIKANQTATTMVTFEVPLQINARPWAQVFLDGPERQPLGQTPLSGVRVPIGSLLIFENPNFVGKNYRVTGRETEIRMTFP